jgi:tetratricopeptide (TPR) repeat protein
LLAEGRLTPEQAIQLAEILESGALGEQTGLQGEGAPSAPMASTDRSAETQLASVSEAEFDTIADEAYTQAFAALTQHPDQQIRIAAGEMTMPQRRGAAMQTLWQYAQTHPDDPLVDEIYLLCGSIGEANGDPLGQRALEVATNLEPRNPGVWRMLSRSYSRTNRGAEAEAAATVSQGVEAQNQGNAAEAEQRLQEALPNLTAPALRAPVVSQLGQIAEGRNDFTSASARYAEAYRLREQSAGQQPAAGARSAGAVRFGSASCRRCSASAALPWFCASTPCETVAAASASAPRLVRLYERDSMRQTPGLRGSRLVATSSARWPSGSPLASPIEPHSR